MERKVIITGAAAGIGKGITSAFADKGYQVILVDRNADTLERVKIEFEEANPNIRVVTLATDLATEQGRQSLIGQVSETDVLVNNIGYYENVDFF